MYYVYTLQLLFFATITNALLILAQYSTQRSFPPLSLPLLKHIIYTIVVEGPCLIHTMTGDLLRSLDPPSPCSDPQSLVINREGYITSVYNSSHVCLFNLNGRLLLHQDIKSPIKVTWIQVIITERAMISTLKLGQ